MSNFTTVKTKLSKNFLFLCFNVLITVNVFFNLFNLINHFCNLYIKNLTELIFAKKVKIF